MKLLGIVWTGVQTPKFTEMAAFIGNLAGQPPGIEEPGFALWAFPDGDLLELFAAGTKPPFENAPVVGFLVDDLESARRDLETAGAHILGGYGPNDDGYATIHFRAPDGNIYELVHDPARQKRAAQLQQDSTG